MRNATSTTWIALVTLVLGGCASIPDVSPALVGKWTWTRAANNCVETYDYRPDGSYVGQSGAEKTEGTYALASKPNEHGLFKLSVRIVRDHGGIDCADSEADGTGAKATVYVRFLQGGDSYRVCYDPGGERCFGPLRRMGGGQVDIAAGSGWPREIGHWYSVNPDCSSRGEPAIRIVTSPAHGALKVEKGVVFPDFPEGNVRHFCNIQRVPSANVYYLPDRGFSGGDSATIEVLFPDGDVRRLGYRVAVWPTPLVRVSGTEPSYPEEARARSIEGRVVAWAYIDSEGNVTRVEIKESPDVLLSGVVRSAVMKWKFEPPTHERTPAVHVGSFDFVFGLKP